MYGRTYERCDGRYAKYASTFHYMVEPTPLVEEFHSTLNHKKGSHLVNPAGLGLILPYQIQYYVFLLEG
jgi:hypothetical protein